MEHGTVQPARIDSRIDSLRKSTAKMMFNDVARLIANAKRDFSVRWQLATSQQMPIIIYQMGKVGSISLLDSLQRDGLHNVYSVHRLNPQNLRRVSKTTIARRSLPRDDRLGELLYQQVVQPGRSAKYITLVREPISRNVSGFFQNLDKFLFAEYGQIPDYQTLEPEAIFKLFMQKYSHSIPLKWFDVELKQTLGIDVYNYPFSTAQGYQRIVERNLDLLILKTELADGMKAQAIADFLNLKDFQLTRSNVGEQKPYAALYQSFQETIGLPTSYIQDMCSSKYAQHFYSPAELAAVGDRWSKPLNAAK